MVDVSDGGVRARALLALGAALVLVALAHAGALDVGFVRDDHLLVEENPQVREPAPLAHYLTRAFWSAPGGPAVGSYYRPLVVLSFVVDWQLWRGAPRGFHATNLALHLAVCALVFALARRFGAGPLAAALACASFGTFPRVGEAVVWISGRTDLLAAFGALGALTLHTTTPKPRWLSPSGLRSAGAASLRARFARLHESLPRWLAPSGLRSAGAASLRARFARLHARRCFAAIALLAGLLAKEVAFAGVLAIAAFEWRAREPGEPPRAVATRLAPLALACVAYLALRTGAELPAADFDPFPPFERPLFALEALGTYVWMLGDALRPGLLIGKLGAIHWGRVALGALVAAAGAACVLRAWRTPPAPELAATLVLGAAALAPVLHLVPLPLAVVAADRFLYLPLAALATALALASRRLSPRGQQRAVAVCGIALVAFGGTTHLRARDWKDELELWRGELARAPALSGEAHAEVATVLAWRGRSDEAVTYYEEALRRERAFAQVRPEARADRPLRSNYALVLSEVGRYPEAIALLEAIAREQPRSARHQLDLGAVRARALEFDAAERALANAAAVEPEWALVTQMLRQVQKARALWLPLPPPRPGEALPIRVARARVYTLVGRLRDADRAWSELADTAGVPADVLRAAQRYLARRGPESADARRALARLEERAARLRE